MKVKYIIALALLLAICVIVFVHFYMVDGLTQPHEQSEIISAASFHAMVVSTSSSGRGLSVEVMEDLHYLHGLVRVSLADEFIILDADGNESTLSALNYGQQIVVYFNGRILESNPPQIHGVQRIRLVA